MDVNNAPELALADGLVPSGDPLALPVRVRWRQRAVGRCRAAPAGAPALPGRSGNAARALASHASADADEAEVARDTAPSHGPAPAHAAAVTQSPRHVAHIADAIEDREARDVGDTRDTPSQAHCTERPPASGCDADAAPTAAATDPQLAPRDIELWLLARRAHGAALRLDFELRTALARQVFRRDFVYVSRQLHALEASRRVQGLDRARLNDALATLRQRADAIQAFLSQRTAQLQADIDSGCESGARIAFARPARFQATIVSPGAHRFLSLLLQADEMLARLETAWLLGLVEPAQRSALVSDCRRALLGFKELACGLRNDVGVLVQEVNAQRRDEA